MREFIKFLGCYMIVGFIFTIPFFIQYYKNRDIKLITYRLKAQLALIGAMSLSSILTKKLGYRDSFFMIPNDIISAIMINIVYLFIGRKKKDEDRS